MTQKRQEFRETVFNRDNNTCTVPWCEREAVDAHHIIERSCWENGGYIPENGASVCEQHHKYAEDDIIPPQAFWMWIGLEPNTPSGLDRHIDKWGNEIEAPPWKEHRENIKYPSSRHLPFSNIGDKDDTYHRQVEPFVGIPLVVTHKMDGSNAMLIKDTEHPVRARNGRHAKHESFDLLKDLYWEQNVYEKIPSHLQVFGEWIFAKHSIHYGCDCDEPCEDVGPSLSEVIDEDINDNRAYFQVFGVYDTTYDVWLSWPSVEHVADEIGFPTVPVIKMTDQDDEPMYQNRNMVYDDVYKHAKRVVENGGEGVVIRSKFPFHYGQFGQRLGKYVRKNHVKTDEHWSKKDVVPNNV